MSVTWEPTPDRAHTGRHRSPHRVRPVNEAHIPDLYLADVARHRADGLSLDDAMTRAGIDADDRLTAWRNAT